MTVCVAVSCEQGSCLVVAADTMVTSDLLSREFEHPGRKIVDLSESCIALTAGDALAHTELFNMVHDEIAELKEPSVIQIVETIKHRYQETRKKLIIERVLEPKGFDGFEDFYKAHEHLNQEIAFRIQEAIDQFDEYDEYGGYDLQILVAGTTSQSAHIYGIVKPGTSQCFDALDFHAIGSGEAWALNALIGRGCHRGTALDEALLMVYEAKKSAEKAPGVGSITDITVIFPDGKVDIPRADISGLEPIYEAWSQKRASSKGRLKELFKKLERNASRDGGPIAIRGRDREPEAVLGKNRQGPKKNRRGK